MLPYFWRDYVNGQTNVVGWRLGSIAIVDRATGKALDSLFVVVVVMLLAPSLGQG